MANILTATEAANVLRCANTDPLMLDLLPSVDRYIESATGHDWTADSPINPTAKSAARMLLVVWHESPGMVGQGITAMSQGLAACLMQLEALASRYYRFTGRDGAGAISVPGAEAGDTVTALVGLIGVSGDRKADFETVITVNDELQQIATGDLSANWYQALLTPGCSHLQ